MKRILLLSFLALVAFAANAQRNCAAMDVLDRDLQLDPGLQQRMDAIEQQTQRFVAEGAGQGQRVVVTIPVVFHIVWRTNFPSENITDAQVMSQLNVLNQDFRRLNTDANLVPADFAGLAADCEVQFCMAQRTPAGAASTGIVRYQSPRTSDWGTSNAVKLPAQGGIAPWDASKYLNVWVCSIGGGILGYAQFPGGSLSTDGVVCDYRYFGTTGTATAPFNRGRTMTHEVGHWLNLRHIWGDATCGSDLVNDTPTHNTSNYGCPAQPHYSTCTGSPREQTMNYMDYTDDACMYMFSTGQKARMQALFAAGGARVGLTTSNGCQAPVAGACTSPIGLTATNITQTSATLSWTAVAGATAYNLQWRVNGAATWTTVSNLANATYSLTGLTAGTTYNFQVATVCGATTTAYSTPVNFATLTACTDAYESNNTRGTSRTIPVNTNITARVGTSTDLDWFMFTTTNAAPKVKVDLTNLPADYDVRLYNANGTQLAISQNTGTTAELIRYNTPTVGATYFVQVYGYNGAFNASACYNLRISTQAANWRDGGDFEAESEIVEFGPIMGENNFSFRVFPNPVSDQATITFDVQQDQEVRLSVTDLTGRVVLMQQTLASTSNQLPLDLSSLPRGLYFVRMENGREQFTQKVVLE